MGIDHGDECECSTSNRNHRKLLLLVSDQLNSQLFSIRLEHRENRIGKGDDLLLHCREEDVTQRTRSDWLTESIGKLHEIAMGDVTMRWEQIRLARRLKLPNKERVAEFIIEWDEREIVSQRGCVRIHIHKKILQTGT